MATNRKSESAAVRLGPAVKAFLLCALIAASGVGFVWQKSQLQALGREITARESVLNDLRRQNRAMRERLDTLCRPSSLDARVRSLGLGLGPPAVTQVIRLTELPPRETAPEQGGFAAQTTP
jgi:transposase